MANLTQFFHTRMVQEPKEHTIVMAPGRIRRTSNSVTGFTCRLIDMSNLIIEINIVFTFFVGKEFQYPGIVPRVMETHGGDDVGIFAIGMHFWTLFAIFVVSLLLNESLYVPEQVHLLTYTALY